MRTFAICSHVGLIGRGIPSEDVAIAIAVDACLYSEYGGEDEDTLVRRDVVVRRESCSSPIAPYIYVDGREEADIGIHPEERCHHCGSRPRHTAGIGW